MNYTEREYLSCLNDEEWTSAISYLRKGFTVMEAIAIALNEVWKDKGTPMSDLEREAHEQDRKHMELPPYADDVPTGGIDWELPTVEEWVEDFYEEARKLSEWLAEARKNQKNFIGQKSHLANNMDSFKGVGR